MDRKRNAGSAQPQNKVKRLSEVTRPDFFEGFLQATEHLSSPEIFRKWAAIGLMAGALERKVWVRTLGSNLYPNMYILLVAPPGVGKTEVTWRINEMWSRLDGHFVASSSVTKASLMDELNAAERSHVTHNKKYDTVDSFNSLKIVTNEIGVLIPAYDNEFINALTDLWDCKSYSESRRHKPKDKEPINIQKAQLNMIAAATPSYLMNTLPEGAWDQGFISRCIMVFSGERQLKSLFHVTEEDEEEANFLQSNLDKISKLYGRMEFSQEAAELIDAFHLRDGEPKPQHPKLASYNIRRTVHLIKLCMVASVSRADDLVIYPEDYRRAFDWLTEAELFMPDIFKAMNSGGTGKIMEEAWYYLFTTYSKEQRPVMSHRLIQYLQARVPVHNIENTIKMMEQGKMIEKILVSGGAAYKPLGKKDELL